MHCRICTHVSRSEIEKACRKTPAADVAESYGVNENALVRHIAAHSKAKEAKAPKKKPAKARDAMRAVVSAGPRRAPAAPVVDELDADDEAPATSRSPSPPPTARAALDEILSEIRTLMKSVNERRSYKGADGEEQFEDVPFADKAAAIRAALQATRLLAGLTGELGATEATVASSPYFKRMLGVILEAVRGPQFGAARQAIIEALEREERGGAAREDQAA